VEAANIKLIQYSYNSLLKEPYSFQALKVEEGKTLVDEFKTFTQLEPFLEELEAIVPLFAARPHVTDGTECWCEPEIVPLEAIGGDPENEDR
jgi:hypothetical protein